MKINPFIALTALAAFHVVCLTGCVIETDPAAPAFTEQKPRISPQRINNDGNCPPGYQWDGSWCVITANPGPIPPMGGGSCIAPACKSACGSRRTNCVAACQEDSYCVDWCYEQFGECIQDCCL